MLRSLLLTVITALAVGACGADASDEPITHPDGGDEVVLQLVRSQGGPPPPGFLDSLRRVPSLTLYGDGTLIRPAGEPDAALASLQQARLTAEGMQIVLRAARDADLLEGGERVDYPGIFDAGSMTFEIHAGGGEHVVTVIAPGSDGGDQPQRREEIREFRELFFDLAGWLGAEVTPLEPLEVQRVLVVVVPSLDPPFTLGEPEYRPWPGAGLGDEATYQGTYSGEPCFILEGAALTESLPELMTATEDTVWQSAGRDHQVVLRPVLPHEDPCR